MSGNLGRDGESLTHHGARVRFEERTSDPSSTMEGEAWLRTDLAPETDQLATLRFDNGSGTWDVPVFDVGTSGADVEEVFRVQVGGTQGYVPIADDSLAAFDQLRFRHAGSTHRLHDAVELPALPDGVVDNFESADAGIYASGETIADYYSGDTGEFARTTSNVTEGSHAVQTAGNGENAIVSEPGDGLNRYPDPGETVGFLVRIANNNPLPGPLFNADAAGGSPSGYFCRISVGNAVLYRVDDGSTTELARDDNVSLSNQTWFWGEFDVPPDSGTEEGDMEFRLSELNESDNSEGSSITAVAATDTSHTDNRGVGWRTGSSSDTEAIGDWMRVDGDSGLTASTEQTGTTDEDGTVLNTDSFDV